MDAKQRVRGEREPDGTRRTTSTAGVSRCRRMRMPLQGKELERRLGPALDLTWNARLEMENVLNLFNSIGDGRIDSVEVLGPRIQFQDQKGLQAE
ncbi:hypothetical protein ACJZ2D_006574 [Fusarium nematophilum]